MTTIGRPTRFHPDVCAEARNHCVLGAINDELAEFFDVSASTIDRWIAERADSRDAVRSGRDAADAPRGARPPCPRDRLRPHLRAHGRHRQRSEAVTSTIHYSPNVQAWIFWLRNRRRRTWSDPGRDAPDDPSTHIDDIALLDAAGESVRHHDGD